MVGSTLGLGATMLSNSRSFAPALALTPPPRTQCRTRLSSITTVAALHGVRLAGCGSSVPQKALTNHDLEKLVETNDEWITSRTGIRKRHVLAEGEGIATHAAAAGAKALEMAAVSPDQVDLIILATSSPDDLFGSACATQAILGAKNAAAFDLTAACSGFVMALVTGSQFIKTGTYKNILVIGADALSRYVDWRDRSTCILFGDGCGAVLLTAQPDGTPCSLLGLQMKSDGNGQRHLNALFSDADQCKPLSEDGKASGQGSYCNIGMNGQEVFKFAVRAVPTVIQGALDDAGLDKSVIDWLVLHQANARILSAAADRLGVPMERVVANLSEYGNTSAASIPLALDEAVRRGDIKGGQVLGMAGFGAGLSWAGAIVRWG
jgi:3-oxoacyl-[acyl-carrier-protein] synthase III